MEEEKYILIVDDEEDIIELIIRGMVTKWEDSYKPLVATDGYEALDFMRSKEIAAVVLDIRMHNMNGVQVCREVMADNRMKNIPIIISSGCLDTQLKAELSALGVKHFMDKPYRIDSLFNKIEEAMF